MEGLHDQDKNGTSPLSGCVEGGPEARDRGGSFQTLSILISHRAVAHLKYPLPLSPRF